MNKPSIGRIVIYKVTQSDKDLWREGNVKCHTTNIVDELPAMIVQVWSDTCVNLKVELDGLGQMWKTSITEGDLEGQWHWPVIK